MTVRPIRPDDVPAVVDLVRELADYERALSEVQLTEEELQLINQIAPQGAASGERYAANMMPLLNG